MENNILDLLFNNVDSVASKPNVPLPWIGKQTYSLFTLHKLNIFLNNNFMTVNITI